MFQSYQLLIVKTGYFIVLLACYAATARENGSTLESNPINDFPIQLPAVSSLNNIKSYLYFASLNLHSLTKGRTSGVRNTIASNIEASKSDLGPVFTLSTSTNKFQPLVANNLSRSVYKDSIKTSSALEETTSISPKVCPKIHLARSPSTVPSASVSSLPPSKETKSSSSITTYKETKLNSFTQAALSVPAVQKFLSYKISGLEAAVLFFNHAYNTLQYFGAPNYASNANEISKAVSTIDVLTLPRYFQATGNAIQKFLLSKGIDILSFFPQNYANQIEESVLSVNIDGPVSLFQALLIGFSNFISSLGFCDGNEADNLSFIYSSELASL